MARALALKLGLLAVFAIEWLLLPFPSSMIAMAFTLAAFVTLLTWLIVSPRAQWFVPTVHRGDEHVPSLALTFDDGPDPVVTKEVLRVLREHDAKATFFVVGERVLAHPDVVRAIESEGHLVGSHSFTHSHSFHFGGRKKMAEDIQRGIDAIASVTGSVPRFFRPPQGLRVPTLRDALRLTKPVTCVTWSARGRDSLETTPEAIVARLEHALVPGAILTLHDGTGLGGGTNRAPTLEALKRLLETMRQKKIAAVRLDDLLGRASP